MDSDMSKEKIDESFADADADSDGSVNAMEFMNAVTGGDFSSQV